MLVDRFYAADEVLQLPGGLDETDAAIMTFAEKVADDASSVTRDDVERLRALGLSDAEITDVVLAAALRSFFAKTLDGLGALPDAVYGELDPALRDALTVGRPIAS
jgi:alkylhydroperoxidase family enzyme